jgi:hypothetical protein
MTEFDHIKSAKAYELAWTMLAETERVRKFLNHDFRSTVGKSRAFLDIFLEKSFPNGDGLPPEALRTQQLLDRSMNELDEYNKTLMKRVRKIVWVVERLDAKKEMFLSDQIHGFTGIGESLFELKDFYPDIIALPMAGIPLPEKTEFELKIRKTRVLYYDEEVWRKTRAFSQIFSI